MQYKKEVIITSLVVVCMFIIVSYVVHNQNLLEAKKNMPTAVSVNNQIEQEATKAETIHDTYTGVFMSGKDFSDSKIMKVDNAGTVAFEVIKEGKKLVHFGSWVINTQKELVVSILGDEQLGEYDAPLTIVLSYNNDNLLVANTYDRSKYTEADMQFRKLKEKEISDLVKLESESQRVEPLEAPPAE